MSNIISNDLKKKKKNKRKASRKHKIAIGLIGILLVVGATGGWYFWTNRPANSNLVDQSGSEILDKVADDWSVANKETDFDKGQALLMDKLDKSTTDARRAEVYAQLSNLALNNGRYDVAHEYAVSSDKLDPTEWAAFQVATTADSLGQRDLAVKYYKIAIERAEKIVEEKGDKMGSVSRFIGEMNRHIDGTML